MTDVTKTFINIRNRLIALVVLQSVFVHFNFDDRSLIPNDPNLCTFECIKNQHSEAFYHEMISTFCISTVG